MKVLPLFTASLLLGCASLADAQPATPSPAQQILRACAKTYKSLSEFKGDAIVVSQSSINGSLIFDNTDAHFDFKRDTYFNIDGHDNSHSEYSIASTPLATTTRWPLVDGGKDHTEEDFPMAVAKFTGVASMAPTLVSTLLVDTGARLPFDVNGEATLKSSEIFGGHPCFVITQKTVRPPGTDTYWIDTKTFLLRGIREEQGAYSFTVPAIEGQPKEIERDLEAKIAFSSHLHVFSIEQTSPTEAELETAAKPTIASLPSTPAAQ